VKSRRVQRTSNNEFDVFIRKLSSMRLLDVSCLLVARLPVRLVQSIKDVRLNNLIEFDESQLMSSVREAQTSGTNVHVLCQRRDIIPIAG
jgi:hypothetical protein